MKIIKTSNIQLLKGWLIGMQIDSSGGYSEGSHAFSPRHAEGEHPKTLDETKALIEHYITYEEPSGPHDTFVYYDDFYRFKMPSEKNLNLLAKEIFEYIENEIAEILKEEEEDEESI